MNIYERIVKVTLTLFIIVAYFSSLEIVLHQLPHDSSIVVVGMICLTAFALVGIITIIISIWSWL